MLRCMLVAASAIVVVSPATAQAPAPFKDKTVTIVTSTGAGGSYDVTAHVPRKYHGERRVEPAGLDADHDVHGLASVELRYLVRACCWDLQDQQGYDPGSSPKDGSQKS